MYHAFKPCMLQEIKMKVNKNLAIKNFTAGTCRRQKLGAEVTGRTSWPGLKTSKNHAKIQLLI